MYAVQEIALLQCCMLQPELQVVNILWHVGLFSGAIGGGV